jgi:hypothetical protein
VSTSDPAASSAKPQSHREWLTIPQLAREYHLGRDKWRGFIVRGELAAINIANDPHSLRPRYMVSRAAVEAFLESRRVVPPAPKPVRRRADAATPRYV